MAISKECQECRATFYGNGNICHNCRDKKRVEEAEKYADWVTQYDNCYGEQE